MDRLDYYFRQKVTEAELDQGFENCEQADRDLSIDLGLVGMANGAVVSEKAGTPNISVDVTAGAGYDQAGQRMSIPSTQNVDVSQDNTTTTTAVAGAPNEKIVSLFLKFERVLSDPRLDGNSLTVFFDRAESFSFYVTQGAESVPPAVPPPLESDKILLADITRDFGQTQIFDADISIARRQNMFVLSTTNFSVNQGRAEEAMQAILGELEDHVGGDGSHPATQIDYGGGPNWADGGTNPATTAEAQFDKIVSDLASTLGTAHVGGAAVGGSPNALGAGTGAFQLAALLGLQNTLENALAANTTPDGASLSGAEAAGDLLVGTVRDQLDQLDTEWGRLARENTWTETQLTNPSGGGGDAALNDIRTDTYNLLWESQGNGAGAVKNRIYSAAGGAFRAFILTENLYWNGTSNNFAYDSGTGGVAIIFDLLGSISVRQYVAAGPVALDSGHRDELTLGIPFSDTTTLDATGIISNNAAIDVYVAAFGTATAASQPFGDGITFPKLFSVAPSSFTWTTHTIAGTAAANPTITNAQPHGLAAFVNSNGAGTVQFQSSLNLS